jgi:hypothetical protein
MKYDFRRLMKEAIVDSFMYHCGTFLGAMRKRGKILRVSGFPAENGRGYHSNSCNTADLSETTLHRCTCFSNIMQN